MSDGMRYYYAVYQIAVVEDVLTNAEMDSRVEELVMQEMDLAGLKYELQSLDVEWFNERYAWRSLFTRR